MRSIIIRANVSVTGVQMRLQRTWTSQAASCSSGQCCSVGCVSQWSSGRLVLTRSAQRSSPTWCSSRWHTKLSWRKSCRWLKNCAKTLGLRYSLYSPISVGCLRKYGAVHIHHSTILVNFSTTSVCAYTGAKYCNQYVCVFALSVCMPPCISNQIPSSNFA